MIANTLFRYKEVRTLCASLFMLAGLLGTSAFSLAQAATGVEWLVTQAIPDGSYTNAQAITTPFQSTSEILQTFQLLGETNQPGIPAARVFINATSFNNTEYLSRKIIAESEAGNDVTALIIELLTHQNSDGGFGDLTGFASSALDTSFALEAFAISGTTAPGNIGQAVAYLISNQNADGGWSFGANENSVYLTALVSHALLNYRSIFVSVPNSVNSANTYLLAQRDASTLWGETFQSALALITIISSSSDTTLIEPSVSALRNAQAADGSWDGDVYNTALALRALFLFDNPPPDPTLAEINGQVVDGLSGLPLSNVTVTLTGPMTDTFSTGSDGLFTFTRIPSGNYTLQFTLPDFATLTASTVANAGQTVDLGAINLLQNMNATTGTVRGTVTDAITGAPLSGVSIAVSGISTPAITDSAGNYQITNVSPGTIIVQATKSGFSNATGTGGLVAGGILVFSPSLSSGNTTTTVLAGKVTDGSTGLALSGVTVSVTGSTTASAVTAADGTYRIEGINAGMITIQALLAGFDTATVIMDAIDNNTIIFSPTLFPTNTTPPNSNVTGVTGTVVDATTNAPLANVLVVQSYGGTNTNTTTDANGQFLITNVQDGAGLLLLALTGFDNVNLGITLEPSKITDVGQIRMRPAQIVELLPDLIVTQIDSSATSTNPETLEVTGTATVEISNTGNTVAPAGIDILAFYDANKNNVYDAGIDDTLGTTILSTDLIAGDNANVSIVISGSFPFRDAPIKAWVDSTQLVLESDETNNVTVNACVAGCIPVDDDFEDGRADGWTEIPNQVGSFANWSIENGEYSSDGGGGSFIGDTNWVNYTYQARIRFPEGANNDASLLFRNIRTPGTGISSALETDSHVLFQW